MRPMGELVPYRPALASAIPPKLGSGPGDPPTTTWRGVEFRAGETMRIEDVSHIDAARGNRFFRVGKHDPECAGQA
jgi:hypothetical protein